MDVGRKRDVVGQATGEDGERRSGRAEGRGHHPLLRDRLELGLLLGLLGPRPAVVVLELARLEVGAVIVPEENPSVVVSILDAIENWEWIENWARIGS